MLEVAKRWGLTGKQVQDIHNDYLSALVMTALLDGVVTEAERRDLNDVAQLLGHDAAHVDTLIALGEHGFTDGAQRKRRPAAGDIVVRSLCLLYRRVALNVGRFTVFPSEG